MSLSRERFEELVEQTYQAQYKNLDAPFSFTLVQLAYEAGRRDEREACAQIAEAEASVEGIGQRIAKAIREGK